MLAPDLHHPSHAWPHRFADRHVRAFMVDDRTVGTTVYLTPARGPDSVVLKAVLDSDGKGLTVMLPMGAPPAKDVEAMANTLRQTAWSLDQALPDAPLLFMDPTMTHPVVLQRCGVNDGDEAVNEGARADPPAELLKVRVA